MSSLTERALIKSLTMKDVRVNQERPTRRMTTLGVNEKVSTNLSIPEILLLNVPTNICPSFAVKRPKNEVNQRKMSLLLDFGLAPNSHLSLRDLNNQNHTHRTITLSDLMSKKNIRKLFSSQDLGEISSKMNKKKLINDKRVRTTMNVARSPYKMDTEALFKSKATLITSKRVVKRYGRNSSVCMKDMDNCKGNSKIDTLNSIVKSCNDLLQDNKKTKKIICDSSKLLTQEGPILKTFS